MYSLRNFYDATKHRCKKSRQSHPDVHKFDWSDEWDSYAKFKAWYAEQGFNADDSGPLPILHKRDVNLGYSPENCYIEMRATFSKHKYDLSCSCHEDPLYAVWYTNRQKCRQAVKKHPELAYIYTFYEPWDKDFLLFRTWCRMHGYTKGAYLLRKDKYKGFTPDNCYFGTSDDQHRDSRGRVYYNYKGELKFLDEWEKTGLFTEEEMKYIRSRAYSTRKIDVRDSYGNLDIEKILSIRRKKRLIEFQGETHSISEWAEIVGIPRNTLYMRIVSMHWPLDRAMTESVA